MRTGKQGFTLIELLVVVSIIAVIMSLLLVSLQLVRQKGNETATRSLMDSLQVAIGQYYTDWGGVNPPAFMSTGTPSTNEGAEMLYLALNSRTGRSTRYYGSAIQQDKVSDTDDDKNLEYVDSWGDCLVYFDSPNYAKSCPYITSDKMQFTATPQKDPKTGRFYKIGSFMLWSIGKDAVNKNGLEPNVSNFN